MLADWFFNFVIPTLLGFAAIVIVFEVGLQIRERQFIRKIQRDIEQRNGMAEKLMQRQQPVRVTRRPLEKDDKT